MKVNSFFVIIIFLISFFGKQLLSGLFPLLITNPWLKLLYFYAWWFIPVMIYLLFTFRQSKILYALGLNNNVLKGILFALGAVSPMLLSAPFIGSFNDQQTFISFIHSTVFAGFMEEFLFRGFLFGLLFRYCGWGLIPAGTLGAIIFGLGHVYQGHDIISVLAVFFVTAVGALWFSWLFIEWNYNLWIPIFLHVLMNMSWSVFQLDDNAAGGLYSNLFRAVTIAITVIITLKFKRTEGLLLSKKIFWKNQETIV